MNARNGHDGFLILLGADGFLRERAVAAALRCFRGPIVGVTPGGQLGRNRCFDDVLRGNPFSVEEVLAATEDHVRRDGRRPVGVVPLMDWALPPAHAVANAYSLPSLSAACIERCRNKSEMKRVLRAHGLPTPEYREFAYAGQLPGIGRALGYPLVIKPRDFGGSGGVVKIDTEDDIAAAFEHSKSVLTQYAAAHSIADDAFQAEEYVAADEEVSVEVLVVRGEPRVLAVTDKYLGPEPWFAELGHVVPSIHRDDPELARLACEACRALGIDRGIAHVEIRLSRDVGPKLMEVAARTAGGGIVDLVERVYGISPYELHIAGWLDREPSGLGVLRPRGTGAIAFLAAPDGEVVSIRTPTVPDAAVGLTLTWSPGHAFAPAMDWRERAGALELFWPGALPTRRNDLHVRRAAELSRSIFSTAPRGPARVEPSPMTEAA